MFALGILATVLSSAYILWMYKRVFFGKIPKELEHVKDSNRYITATMGVLAALTLIVGVYPDLFLNPITNYISGIFEGQEGVLPIPVADISAESGGNAENVQQNSAQVQIESTAGAEVH